jgi:hypothetical protein
MPATPHVYPLLPCALLRFRLPHSAAPRKEPEPSSHLMPESLDFFIKIRRRFTDHDCIFQVEHGGVKKLVKTSTVLTVMKNRARELQKQLQSLPMRLIDLGSRGLRWVRDIPGTIWNQPTKFDRLASSRGRWPVRISSISLGLMQCSETCVTCGSLRDDCCVVRSYACACTAKIGT